MQLGVYFDLLLSSFNFMIKHTVKTTLHQWKTIVPQQISTVMYIQRVAQSIEKENTKKIPDFR